MLGCIFRVTFVNDGDDGSEADNAFRGGRDDFNVLEERLDLANTTFHVTLLVFGSVVVAIFLKVAKFARPFDFVGYFDASARGEVGKFGLQALIRGLGELVLCHAVKGYLRKFDPYDRYL